MNICNQSEIFTNQPITGSRGAELSVEFADLRNIQKAFGLKRGLIYLLIKEGAIKSVSVRRRGQIRGKRLIHVASVRDYLALQMKGGVR